MANTTSESWSGRMTFILASIGAAVGLGNIWLFPYVVSESGGSAFVLVYLLAIFLIAAPIMLGEMVIGRSARLSAPSAMKELGKQSGSGLPWQIVGWMGLFALVLVLSFYSVIASWTAAYLIKSASGGLAGLSAAEVVAGWKDHLHSPGQMIFWHFCITAATVFIVSRGVKIGLEKAVKVLMPALFFTLVALVINSAIVGDFSRAFTFLFSPDISKLTPPIILAAIGQAFFSVNVGVGAVLTYAAYLPKDVNLFKSAVTISLGDTLVALLAGLAIFPIVFANGLEANEAEAGLIFVTLSTAFAKMPGGSIIGTAFFLMLLFAAITSTISMLEAMTARASEKRGLSRPKAAILIGSCTFLLGLVSVFSFSDWEDFYPLASIPLFAESTPFKLMIYAVQNVLMPIGAILYALFVGWWLPRSKLIEEVGMGEGAVFKTWLLLVRVIAPLAVAAVLVVNIA